LEPTATNCLKATSEMMIFHIGSVAKERMVEKIGEILPSELQQALETLKDITSFIELLRK
jgi:mRNA interferase MazF